MNKNKKRILVLLCAAVVTVTGGIIAAAGQGDSCNHSYKAAALSGSTVTLKCEHCSQTTQVNFDDYINHSYDPLDVVEDGIVNAKDYAYLSKHYNEFGAVNGFEEGTTDWDSPEINITF